MKFKKDTLKKMAKDFPMKPNKMPTFSAFRKRKIGTNEK